MRLTAAIWRYQRYIINRDEERELPRLSKSNSRLRWQFPTASSGQDKVRTKLDYLLFPTETWVVIIFGVSLLLTQYRRHLAGYSPEPYEEISFNGGDC